MKVLVAIAIFIALIATAECGYAVYRGYWSPSNTGVNECTGQPDNVALYTSSTASVDCGSASGTASTTTACTTTTPAGYKYRDLCKNVGDSFTSSLTTNTNPFTGNWVEVRHETGAAPSDCATGVKDSNTLVGWFQNGVCARSYAYTLYNSRATLNATAGEARINCAANDCETGCGYIGTAASANNGAISCFASGSSYVVVRTATGAAATSTIAAAAIAVAAVLLL